MNTDRTAHRLSIRHIRAFVEVARHRSLTRAAESLFVTQSALSLTIQNAAAGSYGLHIGLAWWIPGMLLAGAYAVFTYRRFSGKLRIE